MNLENLTKSFLESYFKSNSGSAPYLWNKSNSFDPKKDSVYYSGPFWDHEEIESAIKCLVEGQWLSSGEKVNQFERKFSKIFNFKESLMVNSGSSANLVMIASLKKYFDWNDGDEIIVSVVGFPTTAGAIIQNNLVPKFIDINLQDLNWNTQQIKQLITKKTRAVFSSPVLGNPGDFDLLLNICDDSNILVISDNCDSLGSKWKDKFLTDYSVAASCSFYPAHHITTMEGGMVSSKNSDLVELARSFAWWGRACYCVGKQNLLPNGTCKKRFSNWIPDCEDIVDHKYVFENVGYNLKPLDLQGAIGLAQLKKFEEIDRLRKLNKIRIDGIFSQVKGVKTINESEFASISWFGAPLICETPSLKRSLVDFLENNRIQTRNYFAGNLLMQPGYKKFGSWRDFPNASKVLSNVFFVGVSPTISENMLDYIENTVKNFTI
jgi:CDP-6-deoxy-D-xylo-4-hexulose-3-dehydrase